MLKDASIKITARDVQEVADKLEDFNRGLPLGQQAAFSRLHQEATRMAEEFEVAGFDSGSSFSVLDRLGFSQP
ncbi:MAG: hypothetical protein ACR2PL_27550 [Dehalococcoidia bacterium]